ncbi:glycyl-tRNA synthetase beta chain [Pseudorhodobacter antarcticus]|uniref:Glycine--tRNA ligase beta subunit n=1 Tax=Pseudorhodobacter antarcticus TaxID=1077947 RepID=A0A1H8AY37_9RHOB|nr:glycine--tRNA ligase subunit beta [Pseudorhodobacter antarcticus]SEM75416.1 glycyl-tRNA synthetase beta chain [Pseudorhodobacter antarcticus]
MPDLLLELFSEEIPARMQVRAASDLKKLVTDGLVEAGLTYASAGAFCTPRRLVLSVDGLLGESKPVREERKGPKTDAPDAALQGFLRATGLTREQLETRDDKKGQVYFAVLERPGRAASAIVAEVVEAAVRNFPWPKSMRWGAGTLRWVRPLQSILCILSDEAGAEVVPVVVDHLTAGNVTFGHRFMAPAAITVTGFEDYSLRLRRAFVVLDAGEREAAIWQDAQNQAFAQGLEVVPDAGLLAEVAGLVEWPVVLMGRIDAAFLDLPPEVLQTSMREHQKFFSVRNPKSGRIEGFVTVANRDTADHGATILAGNNKVLSARLSDAKFFWENDLRVVAAKGLDGMGAGLASVTFHNKLGSQADRVARIAALAAEIAPMVGADAELSAAAARVAKADLQSAMVGEFPELQGTMGGYYARAAGMPEAVALACKAHYAPLGPTDAVPTDPVSVAVALADKIDTLTGFWAIDEKPTGSKDPFALRRAALGAIRLILGNGVRIDLQNLLNQEGHILYECFSVVFNVFEPDGGSENWDGWQLIFTGYDRESQEPKYVTFERPRNLHLGDDEMAFVGGDLEPYLLPTPSGIATDLLTFFHDRLKVFLRDEGIRHDIIDACIAMPGNDDLTLLVNRARALNTFITSDDGTNLLQGFKRANNILTQAEAKDNVEYSYGADIKFAETDVERALFHALDTAAATIAPAMKVEDFATAMAALANLRAPIDAFFNTVQVNAENDIIRRNRLNLLHRIRAACAPVADLTKIEG